MNKINLVLSVALACAIAPASAMQRAVGNSRALVRPAANNMAQRNYAMLFEKERNNLADGLWDIKSRADFDQALAEVQMDHEDLEGILERLEDARNNPQFRKDAKFNRVCGNILLGSCVLNLVFGSGVPALLSGIAFCFTGEPNSNGYKFDTIGLEHLKKLVEEKKKIECKQ